MGAFEMKRITLFNLAAFVVVLLLSAGLYKAKTDAAETRRAVERLEREVDKAREDVRVLAAEAAALETPERVAALARSTLDLHPIRPEQRLEFAALDVIAPLPIEPEAAPPQGKTP
jgi:cell division protein FtsL